MTNLTPLEMDSLREIGNVGIGNAATAMSKLIGKKIDIKIPLAEFVPISKFAEKAGGAETVVYCLRVNIAGDLGGESLFFFTKENSLKLADMLMGRELSTAHELDDMDKSSLSEMSNIVVGSYLNSIANMLHLTIFPSPPNSANDMLQAIIDAVLSAFSKSADDVLFIETEFSIEDQTINGNFILLFDYDSLNKLLSKLKEVYGI